ncbi:uncharacterized protein DNG_00272 [Cephalotrichum gorgonifer]|uniref:SWIM-type domain-containing protein n=1 Tax=Cephalotrichum gorgonifer TaxID=2041049 RepID=A0AAE8SR13_9PEZI|nr:uncharacterized protein DNG_00272 [Cephalotrichum gorgonifer]
MPTTPVAELRQLSLSGSMSPPPRPRGSSSRGQPKGDVSSSDEESDSGSSSPEDDEEPTVIRSPSKLMYRIDGLEPNTRAAVRDAFREPPNMALHFCVQRDNLYAFQMTELVYHTIRITPAGSARPYPQCSCRNTSPPCRHVLWLMDRLVKQTGYNRDPNAPLNLTPHGYPEEIGHPFQDISNFHLDLLADSLHCELTPTPGSQDDESDDDDEEEGGDLSDSYRVQEARELLASVAASPPEKYRPDIFDKPRRGKKPLKRGDLECTVFRMLLDNNEFFNYFLSLARPADPVNDPFRKLDRRFSRLRADMARYSASLARPQSSPTTPSPRHPPGPPCDVPWAAHHILGITSLIRAQISDALPDSQRISAARSLVRILSAVADSNHDAHPGPTPRDRNLYVRLIADQDQDFVVGLLVELLDAAAHFQHNLHVVLDKVKVHGAPPSYVTKLEDLVGRLKSLPPVRTSPTGRGGGGAGSKRRGGGGQDRDTKRVK